ncbi:hypothetical protein IAU67_00995 [Corynebacterium zhongnanshanii]|nr:MULTISPECIES: hypothetical protein [Corynebacterium]QNP92444.1 hypothetical protein IAU67_00995 [Corynebacterium zhongnanshanii]
MSNVAEPQPIDRILAAVDDVLDNAREDFHTINRLGEGNEGREVGVVEKTLQQLRSTHAFGLTATAEAHGEHPAAGLRAAIETTRRLARIDGSLAQIPQSHYVFSRYVGAAHRAGEAADGYAREVLDGTVLVANAQVDRDPVRAETGVDGRTRLNGHKIFCTGSPYADILAIVIGGKDVVFVPADAAGISIDDDWHATGQEFTGSGSVRLEDVDVTGLAVQALSVGGAGEASGGGAGGAGVPDAGVLHHGAFAQALHAGIDLGLFEGAVEIAHGLARLPRHADQLPESQATLLGEIDVSLFTAQAAYGALLDSLGRPAEDSQEVALSVTRAKLAIQDAALASVSKLFEVAGSAGYTATRALDRHWRDLRVHTLHDKRQNKLRLLGEHVGAEVALPLDGKLGG